MPIQTFGKNTHTHTHTQTKPEKGAARAQGYKIFFMLNLAEHELLNPHNYENIKEYGIFQSDKPRMLFFLLIKDKMPTKIVGILTFMSRKKFMLN